MRLDCKSRRTGALLPLGVPDIKRAICPYSPFCRICNPTANKISGFAIRLIRFCFIGLQIFIIVASGLQIQTNWECLTGVCN